MPLTVEQKKGVVEQFAAAFSGATSVVVAHNLGLSAVEMTEFRRQARESRVAIKVMPNTLAKKAIQGSSAQCLEDALKGPVLLVLAQEEPGSAARVVQAFAKEHEKLIVRAIEVEGHRVDAAQLEFVASFPTKTEALSRLLLYLGAPLVRLIRGMRESYARCARTIALKSNG